MQEGQALQDEKLVRYWVVVDSHREQRLPCRVIDKMGFDLAWSSHLLRALLQMEGCFGPPNLYWKLEGPTSTKFLWHSESATITVSEGRRVLLTAAAALSKLPL